MTNTTIPGSIGARIRYLRKRKGLTLVQLAKVSGIDQGNLSRVESSKNNPSLDTIRKLADALEITVPYLLDTKIGYAFEGQDAIEVADAIAGVPRPDSPPSIVMSDASLRVSIRQLTDVEAASLDHFSRAGRLFFLVERPIAKAGYKVGDVLVTDPKREPGLGEVSLEGVPEDVDAVMLTEAKWAVADYNLAIHRSIEHLNHLSKVSRKDRVRHNFGVVVERRTSSK